MKQCDREETSTAPAYFVTRRHGMALGGAAIAAATRRAHAAPAEVRLGTLQFGTVQWVADVIRRHGFDAAHGITLDSLLLANVDAGRVALMARSADVVVSDWLFAAAQRAGGNPLCFVAFSNAAGGVLARPETGLDSLAGLAGRKLGVAGGPLDKSWLIVQAAAKAQHMDLAAAAHVVYGAPPLLEAKLRQGELDAVLTFWNFAARLETMGFRQIAGVADCARQLGLGPDLGMVGFIFHEDWARANAARTDGFLAAVRDAQGALAGSGAEWQAVRPLMDAPDDALFENLKRRFVAGIPHARPAEQEQTARRVLDVLLAAGGTRATGGIARLPDGLFWRTPDEAI